MCPGNFKILLPAYVVGSVVLLLAIINNDLCMHIIVIYGIMLMVSCGGHWKIFQAVSNKAVNLFSQFFWKEFYYLCFEKTNLRVTFFLGAIIYKTSNILFMFFKKEQIFCYKEVIFSKIVANAPKIYALFIAIRA